MVEGGTFSGVVATFIDGNPNALASDFTALITWGDGHTSAGVITSTGAGGFSVSGSNFYLEEGTYSVGVQITDAGGASTNSAITAAVAEGALQATAATINATEGNALTGTVASFTDDPKDAAGFFNRGMSRLNVKDYDGALRDFTEAR